MEKILCIALVFALNINVFTMPIIANADSAFGEIVIPVTEDTYVASGTNATKNYGGDIVVKTLAASSVSREIFLKFNMSNYISTNAVIDSAKLAFTTTINGGNANIASQLYQIYRVNNDNWTEGNGSASGGTASGAEITWNSSRAFESTLIYTATVRPTNEQLTEVDLTEAIRNELENDATKTLTLRIVTTFTNVSNTWGLQFYSKEHTTATDNMKPHLNVIATNDLDMASVIKEVNEIDLGDISNITQNLNFPTVGKYGTELLWTTDKPEYLSETGVVTRPNNILGDQVVNISVIATKGEASTIRKFVITIKCLELTNKEKLALDKAEIMLLDGVTTIKDLDFVLVGENGCSITYISTMPNVISNTGVVTRPQGNESNANVAITVNISCGEGIDREEETFDIYIFVPKIQAGNDDSMRESFFEIHQYIKKYIEDAKIGTGAGTFTQDNQTKYLIQLQAIYDSINSSSRYLDCKDAINSIKIIATDFIGTAVTSENVIDIIENKLEFSSYRVKLMQETILGEIALMTEKDMYTESSKLALKEYVDYCNSVLNGTYVRPFTRNREFMKPRDDEDVQFALSHRNRTYPGMPNGDVIGINHLTNWYYDQHMLSGVTQFVSQLPSDDTYIQGGNEATKVKGTEDKVTVGNTRWGFIKFDLTNISGNIQKAVVKMYNATTNNPNMTAYYLPDSLDDWQENSLTYNSWLSMNGNTELSGTEIVKFKPGGLNSLTSIDVTDIAIQEKKTGNGFLSILLDRDAFAYPPAFYSKESTESAKRIVIEIQTDISDKKRLDAKYSDIIGKANTMLSKAIVGGGVGEYPQESYNQFVQALDEAKEMYLQGDILLIGRSLVKLYDAMRTMRNTQVLRQQIEPLSNLFFTEEDAIELKTKISKYSVLKNEYNYLKQLSDQETMENIDRLSWIMNESVPRETINQYFKLINSSGNLTFTPPANTAYGKLEIYLPSEEFEDPNHNGIGHVWIDTVNIAVSGEDNVEIENAGFDLGSNMPDNWTPIIYAGNPVIKWETRPNYVDAGGASICIQNPTSADQGGIKYDGKLALLPGVAHTLTFRHKIDDKLKGDGVTAKISYYTADGTYISNFIGASNKKTGKGNVLSEAQADAIVYAVEGDKYYAEKAKKRLLFSVNDFVQGAEYWLVYLNRPDNIDAYGEVQGGRIMASICATYTLIKDADVFTPEEYKQFMAATQYLARFLMDLRDRTEDDYVRATEGTNWNTDMANGSGMFGITFPDADYARLFLTNGALVLNGHLDNQVYDDGAWPESIRYVGAVVTKFAPFARAINIARGDKWYETTKLPKLFEYLISTHTPPYIYFNNHIATPPFGDHVLGGNELAPLGTYYDQVANVNPKLGQWMYSAWAQSGYPMSNYGGESISLQNFFSPVEFDIKENNPLRLDDYSSSNVGLYIFRENYGRENAKYFSLISNETTLGHGHYDQGTFMLYANSIPLVMDPGIESYFDATKKYYVGTGSHASVLFSNNGSDVVNTPTTSTINNRWRSNEVDTARVTINYGTNGTHKRNIALIEDGIGAVVIWDQITSAKYKTIFNLPVMAKSSSISGNTITSIGHYGTNLKTTILEPQTPKITTVWGQSTEMMPKVNGSWQQNYIKSEADTNKNHFVVLQPLKEGELGATIANVSTNDTNVTAYKLQKLDGTYVIVVVNNAVTSKSISIASTNNLINMKTKVQANMSNGKVNITIAGGEMLMLKSDTLQDPRRATIEIQGGGTIDIPTTGANIGKYNAYVISQYNNTLLDEPVKWSVAGETTGVSVGADDGIVSVDKSGKALSSFKLVATSNGVSSYKNIKLLPTDRKRTSVEITGVEKVAIPQSGTASVSYKAQVLDQFGAPMEDTVEWTLASKLDGVYIKNGVLTFDSTVLDGTKATIVVSSMSSISAIATKTVTLENIKGSSIVMKGMKYISSPLSGNKTYNFSADVLDQNGNTYGDQSVEFELVSVLDGVSITPSGSLTVPVGLLNGTMISLQIKSKTDNMLSQIFNIFVEDNVPDEIAIIGETQLTTPKSGEQITTYTAKVKNILGNIMQVGINWTIDKSVPGVRIEKSTGKLSVLSTAVTSEFNILASAEGFDDIYNTIKIKLTSDAVVPPTSGGGGGAGGISGGSTGGGITLPPVTNESIFNDVPSNYWAYEMIKELKEKNIVKGDQAGNYNPENTITRAEFTQMLMNAFGLNASIDELKLSDIHQEDWYYNAIAQAVSLKIVTGYTDNTFKPNSSITREEIAVMLNRALKLKGIEQADSLKEPFVDDESISDYSKEAVYEMKKAGIINGMPDGTFAPKQQATRSQTAAMIQRFIKLG